MPSTQEQNKSHQLRKKGDIEALQKKKPLIMSFIKFDSSTTINQRKIKFTSFPINKRATQINHKKFPTIFRIDTD
jgi:hypothetical protein